MLQYCSDLLLKAFVWMIADIAVGIRWVGAIWVSPVQCRILLGQDRLAFNTVTNLFHGGCGHMRTKLCARQALRVAVGPRWWQGMVWWQAMARQSRCATVRVLLLSDPAATTLTSTTKVLTDLGVYLCNVTIITAVFLAFLKNSEGDEKGTPIIWL